MTSVAARVVRVFGVFVALTVSSLVTTHSQNKSSEKFAIVSGKVCDSANRPVENATVSLESDDHAHKFTFQSDSQGRYSFEAVPAGNYELRASRSGYGGTTNGPFVVHKADSKLVELRLRAEAAAATSKDDTAAVKFSDDIHFNVAGVNDPSNLGGHGSDTMLRTKETLAKETASLSPESATQPSNNSHAEKDLADTHLRLAEAAEKDGRPLDAVLEYQQAAEMEPNEAHIFAWGADLLLHRAFEPAIEVFAKGHRLYPSSVRMLLGLSVATYDQGAMEGGKKLLLEACDLNPADPAPYLFLGKLQEAEKIEPPGWTERFKRFAGMHPENALAHYYYAVALGKQEPGSGTLALIESELKRAIEIDPKLGNAYLELGILYSQRKDYSDAISAFQKAIEITPLPAEAHYRLGQVYGRMGETEKSSNEIALFKEISEQKNSETERERHKIQQFVYTLRNESHSSPISAVAASPSSPNAMDTAICTLQDGEKISIEYSRVARSDKLWVTGIHDVGEFETTADLFIGGKDVPAGRYTLYVNPGRIHWTVIFSKRIGNHPMVYPGSHEDLARVHFLVANLEEPAKDYSIALLPYTATQMGMNNRCRWRFEWMQTRASIVFLEKLPEYTVQIPPQLEKLKMLADWTLWKTEAAFGPSRCGEDPCPYTRTTFDYVSDFTSDDVKSPTNELFRIRKRIHDFLLRDGWEPQFLGNLNDMTKDLRDISYGKGHSNLSLIFVCSGHWEFSGYSGCDEVQVNLSIQKAHGSFLVNPPESVGSR